MRYEPVELTNLKYAVWDNKKRYYVSCGDLWTESLIKIVKKLWKDGFSFVTIQHNFKEFE